MLVRSNIKLGPNIWSWSIPALATCPGASAICAIICYAIRFRYKSDPVWRAQYRNWQTSKTEEFTHWMIAQIRNFCVPTCRIHAAGDFYDAEYTEKWIEIVRASRQTVFFAYTRSWLDLEILPVLIELSKEPNMHLWWSWDEAMEYPPKVTGIRVAYLAKDDDDHPPRKVDLVFRNNRTTTIKYEKYRSLVCCYDNGVTSTTCTQCGICFNESNKGKRRISSQTGRGAG